MINVMFISYGMRRDISRRWFCFSLISQNEVENQRNKKIKVVMSDRGGRYVSPFRMCTFI
ncbi:hypothetical protein HanXRQr2_Chr10g0454941 [Helianthus annuus]|uniref:Uncharacterized protein n=1 Tax=Helianthus annuus TaxID=4232 RepID=A0A9K3N5V9_HELAN|nr:hypothetical protein HanXRQr2_Chr10g0454941 [Helianthus annuus]KAJ0884914.1 hypothetical protein HanPSC8_Chr10g0439341 [Helianthus annuus]